MPEITSLPSLELVLLFHVFCVSLKEAKGSFLTPVRLGVILEILYHLLMRTITENQLSKCPE